MHYTFQHMSTITKLSQDVTQYYKNITLSIYAITRNKEIYKYEQYKGCSRVYKRKTRETRRGHRRIGLRRSADDSRYHCTTLISNRKNPQAPSSEIWTWRFREVRTPQWVVLRMPSGVQR